MEFYNPKYYADALEILDRSSDSMVICAGLTHLLRFYQDFPSSLEAQPESILHIGDVQGFSDIKEEHSKFVMGSTTRICDIEKDPFIGQFGAAIWDAAHHTSTPQIRNRRSLGGELAWGSFHSGLIASLMAYDAEIRIRRAVGDYELAKEDIMDLCSFYHGLLERKNSRGGGLKCRKTILRPRDLILKIAIGVEQFRRPGSFSFFRMLTPKISTENPGVVVAVKGVSQNGMLVNAQFVASGVWMSTVKESIPLEGTKLKPGIFFEKLYHFCDRYSFESERLSGPSPRQLSLIVFGLLKEGFSQLIGI